MGDADLPRLLLEASRAVGAEVVANLDERGFPDARPGHAAVFMHIDRRSGTRLTDLARRARMTKQGMMLLVDDLETRGYVRRVPDAEDARAKVVRLTARGRRYVAEARRAVAAVEARARRELGDRRYESLRGVLEELIEAGGVPAREQATGSPELVVLPDAHAVARRGAAVIEQVVSDAVAERGSFAIAVSGGRTPREMFTALAGSSVPWGKGGIWQVDERVAPDGHPDRNLTGLLAALPPEARDVVHPMPVTAEDPEAAAGRYATSLPPLDLVHLGLGEDGHTASLVPGDPVLDVRDRDVAVTSEYRGRRRMTVTFALLERARFLLWVVTGADKAPVLPRLIAGDDSIPAGRVRAGRRLVLADAAAASAL